MIKIEKTDVYGWEAAIRGMRNPMNSWDKSDSIFGYCDECGAGCDKCGSCKCYSIGENDHELMMKLAKAGSVHAKYRRMITVTVDITAPLYWWKEFDTYKVGTVANSCSTMHKIHAREFTMDDFSYDKLLNVRGVDDYIVANTTHACTPLDILDINICVLNQYREMFLETKNKKYWDWMIQLLPSSYNQKRTVQMSYESLVGMYRDRKNHKLTEWHTLCDWIKNLPYSEIITLEMED